MTQELPIIFHDLILKVSAYRILLIIRGETRLYLHSWKNFCSHQLSQYLHAYTCQKPFANLLKCETFTVNYKQYAVCGIVWGTIVSNFVTSVVENIVMQVYAQVWKSDGYIYV